MHNNDEPVMKNIICLLLDRLHIGCLGPYGNTEIETPAINALAAGSLLADRFYVDTPNVPLLCRSWWRGLHVLAQNDAPTIMSRLNAAGYKTVLVTDDPAIAYCEDAYDFSEVLLLPDSGNETPCDEIEQTHLCSALATIAETAESLTQSGSPYLLWCQLRGFDAGWDFPLFLREKYCGEDDPTPYRNVTPPFYMKADTCRNEMCDNDETPLSPESWDDLLQSVRSAYSGGVTMFDELLEMLTEPLGQGDFGDETLFLLAGSRGVLFGECGMIGIPPYHLPQPSTIEPLASSLVQVPLIVRFPDGFGATVRTDTLLQPADIAQLLCEWLELPSADDAPNSPNAIHACRNMLDLIREEPQNLRECFVIVSTIDHEANVPATCCLVTPSWFLQELALLKDDHSQEVPSSLAERYALYVKPDDRWDVNNVCDRCIEVVEQLVEVQADLQKRLAVNDDSPLEPLPENLRVRY